MEPVPLWGLSGQDPLHDHDVEPSPELATDLAFAPHLLESDGAVQRDRGCMIANDPGDDGMEAVHPGGGDQVGQNCAPDALAVMGPVHVDRVFDRRGVSGAFFVGREGSKPTTSSSISATTATWAPDRSVIQPC